MDSAVIYQKTDSFVICPKCGANDQLCITLFLVDKGTFGPIHCGACGQGIKGTVDKGRVFVELTNDSDNKPGLLLVRIGFQGDNVENITPIYLILPDVYYPTIDEEVREYIVDEKRCPSDTLGGKAFVIEGFDTDPHGVFEYMQHVEKPVNFDKNRPHTYEDWREIFDTLPERSPVIDQTPSIVVRKLT